MGHHARTPGNLTLRSAYLLDRPSYATTRLSLYTVTPTEDTDAIIVIITEEVSKNLVHGRGHWETSGYTNDTREFAPHGDQDEGLTKHHVGLVPGSPVQAKVRRRVGLEIRKSILSADRASSLAMEAS